MLRARLKKNKKGASNVKGRLIFVPGRMVPLLNTFSCLLSQTQAAPPLGVSSFICLSLFTVSCAAEDGKAGSSWSVPL